VKLVYEHICELSELFPVYLICQVLQVSRSAFYAYKSGESYKPSSTKKAHSEQVRRVFIENKRRYGSRRILARLQDLGLKIGRDSIRAVMRRENLKAIQPKSFVPQTTDSKHGKRNSPNLLLDTEGNRLSIAQAPNQVWVSDITYLPLESGKFGYLATWMDLFSRMIVGWQLADNMSESIIINALEKALHWRRPLPGLIVHSDRGGQYVSLRLRKMIRTHQLRQSMSRADNCYDNAFAESFFGRFKNEVLQGGVFLDLDDAQTEIFEFIEMDYNRTRIHSGLKYKSPTKFEELFYLDLNTKFS
jgi:transposase InsO family protein